MGFRISYRTLILTGLLGAAPAFGQFPDGPGKEETARLCSQCHELERASSLRQDAAGWQDTVAKMSSLGMKATDAELQAVTAYLAKAFPADTIPKLNVNKAAAIDLESALSLRRSQAAAVIEYRKEHGDFKSLDDLKKVPGIDAAKVDAKKDRLTFQ
ncbi:MAG TPA: helix-hairpin-helix domain-containing protein [Bryobacteraceae bacterium]|nr:helix-hairpin-helix domain-containing protein [Bryobacteraceae bacterium]